VRFQRQALVGDLQWMRDCDWGNSGYVIDWVSKSDSGGAEYGSGEE
jgi:hypothetical protein